MSQINLLSPLKGYLTPLETVPDEVFAGRMVGDGVAIEPLCDILSAPCDAEILNIHPKKHALTLKTSSGAQILIHIGIDTVKLDGQGFFCLVKAGDTVTAGQDLIRFDVEVLTTKAKSLVTLMIVTEGAKGHSLIHSGLVDKTTPVYTLDTFIEEDISLNSSITLKKSVKLHMKDGLHARPSALIVSRAKKYRSQVELKTLDKTANAKSVVSLLTAAFDQTSSLTLEVTGPDAQACIDDLAEFLNSYREESSQSEILETVTKNTDPNILSGTPAAPGLARGKIFFLKKTQFQFAEWGIGIEVEKQALKSALSQSAQEILELQNKSDLDPRQLSIFSAHLELLEDPDLISEALKLIELKHSAAFSWNQSYERRAKTLSELKNQLMANRAADLRDVGMRALNHMAKKTAEQITIPKDAILIAEEMTPSETASLPKGFVVGLCTTTGGPTSHVAILARSMGLPAIAGIDPKALKLVEGTEVIIDGHQGELRLNPTQQQIAQAEASIEIETKKRSLASTYASASAHTLDDISIEVTANIGGLSDADQAVQLGADGVGLLRSEFLFLEREVAPSEQEQYEVYQAIADSLGDRPLTIRTLDVGGDKPLRYLPLEKEDNPFLGIRGLRVGFRHPEILREQLRAILRMNTTAPLNIMFPMVSQLDELLEAKKILEQERFQLGRPMPSIGMMIEVPSAALLAHIFAPHIDFFSIGTNDLTQYTLAMDRGHHELAKHVDALNPSVLKLIEMTIVAAKACGKWVSVCGGLASEEQAVPILVGLGVNELSVSLASIGLVKAQIRALKFHDCQVQSQAALRMGQAHEVRNLSKDHFFI